MRAAPRTTLLAAPLLGVAVMLGTAAPAGAAAAADTASVTVVHGLRGLVADVQVDGRTVLEGFAAERSTDALALPAGSRRIVVRSAKAAGGPPVIDTTVKLAAGESRSLVVHLGADGKPVLTSYRNDDAPIPAGQGRVVLRNTAAAPAVQMQVDGKPLGGEVRSRGETDVLLPVAAHTVAVMAAGGTSELLGAQTVDVPAGSSTLLYLIGSPGDDSLGWLAQTVISGQTVAPAGVPTGNSGLKALPPTGGGGGPSRTALLLLAVVAVPTVVARRLR